MKEEPLLPRMKGGAGHELLGLKHVCARAGTCCSSAAAAAASSYQPLHAVVAAFSSTSIITFGACNVPAPDVAPFTSKDDANETGDV